MLQHSAVGIDLGTTYSSIAIVDQDGELKIIPNAESERLTPSAVLFDGETIVVGQIAKEVAASNPDHVVTYVKRQIGNKNWYYNDGQQRHGPAELSALILAKLKRDAELYLNRPIPYAVITVPAYFDDSRRRETLAAGKIAGFQVLDLLNEPTAAAIAFGVTRSQQDELVLVYDLGGGTFDVTLMRIANKDIRILASDGDSQLGGKDFDDAIMNFAVGQFMEDHSFDPTEDIYVANELRINAENAKRQLSKLSRTQFILRAQGKTSRIEITREQFNSLIKSKLDTTLSLVRDVLQEATILPDMVDRVLLIGGSTRVPAVRDFLTTLFGRPPDFSINPDEAVALGAALLAAKRLADLKPEEVEQPVIEKVGGLQITDVTSHSFGIEAQVPGSQQRINAILIPRNSPIPTEVSKEFVTTILGQTAIRVTIYQGEFQDPALCNPVGDFTLSNLPEGRPPGRKVRVTISCGANGVVNVTAIDIETGKQTTTDVSYKIGKSEQEVSAKQRWLVSKSVS